MASAMTLLLRVCPGLPVLWVVRLVLREDRDSVDVATRDVDPAKVTLEDLARFGFTVCAKGGPGPTLRRIVPCGSRMINAEGETCSLSGKRHNDLAPSTAGRLCARKNYSSQAGKEPLG